ncbi:uncharacterized protein [Venturia canescens]|uniref:uncharacterized protein n=1 Tax=Venturia canescens TaxID=32260 RepID=UPI001C9CA09F|nr:uncharacterized protein LOC122413420 [Venturia canescens]
MAGGRNTSTQIFRAQNDCTLPLEVLDFIYDFTQPDLEFIWPCQARSYWLYLQPFVKFVRVLLNYVTPFIIIIGVTLNVVSFGMLNTVAMSDSGLALYLRALALSDNGALIFNYAVGVARSQSLYVNSLFMNSRFLCGSNSVSMELFQFTSTWLVVCLTWARVAAVIFPLQTRKKIYTSRSTVLTIATLTCTSFVISLTKLYYGGYESDSVFEFVPCQIKTKPWGNAMYFYIAFSTWLPSLFIFIGNVLLIVHMRKSDLIRNQLTRTSGTSSNATSRTSRMLLAVSIVYLVLLLPIGIVETLELYWDVVLVKYPSMNNEENARYISWLEEKMLLKWCRGFFFHVYHWNFAINFFLYYLTGKKFRDGVIKAFKNCTKTLKPASFLPWNSCCKITRSLARSRRSNILLIRVITLDEHSVNGNITIGDSNAFRSSGRLRY